MNQPSLFQKSKQPLFLNYLLRELKDVESSSLYILSGNDTSPGVPIGAAELYFNSLLRTLH